MRTILIIAAAMFVSPALAGVLPVRGKYCGSGDNADLVLDTNGLGGEQDGCVFKSVLSSGPHWWVVSQECSNTDDTPKSKIRLSGKAAVVSDFSVQAGKFGAPYTLHACR